MSRWGLLLLCACGRLGFDARADAVADTPSDAQLSLAELLPCDVQVLLDSGGHDPHDVLRWVHDDVGEWLVGSHHYSQTDHRIERHVLVSGSPGPPQAGAAEFMVQANHIDVMTFEPVATGYILGYTDFTLSTADTIGIGPDLLVGTDHPLGILADGNPPLARAGGGGLAMVGMVSGDLDVLGIAEDGSMTSAFAHLATPAQGADRPSMATLDTGLAVVWQAAATGNCQLAKLDANLAVVAGPVDVPITSCGDPHVAWLPDVQRIMVVADDPNDHEVVDMVWDATLTPVGGPTVLGTTSHWARIIADGDSAFVSWALDPTPSVAWAVVDATGAITKLGSPLGALDQTLGHFHTMDRIGGATLVNWVDTIQARTFSVERLCR